MPTPLVVFACAGGPDPRWAIQQARHADPKRPVLLYEHPAPQADWRQQISALAALAEQHGTTALWLLSADTLLFDSLDWPEDNLQDLDLAFSLSGQAVHCLYLKTEALAALSNPANPATTLLSLAAELGLEVEMLDEVRGGLTFDTDLADTQVYRPDAKGTIKHIVWQQGVPFFVHRSTGLVTRAVTLRLPGPLSRQLHRYYTGPGMVKEKLMAEAKALFS